MSYHVYTTLGIVLGSLPSGDADKVHFILTRELGLILASATSVRKVESKLRYGLDDASFAELSFIRGKQRWKITHVQERENFFRTFMGDKEKQTTVFRLFAVVQKLVSGEEQNIKLFDILLHSLEFLKTFSGLPEERLAFEYITVLRILEALGYGTSREFYGSFVETSAWSAFLIRDALPYRETMRADINAALEASHL
jgi:recombinational DNA repair protein (RecF pathway)